MCQVAANTVWSHMAGDAKQISDRFCLKSYTHVTYILPFIHTVKIFMRAMIIFLKFLYVRYLYREPAQDDCHRTLLHCPAMLTDLQTNHRRCINISSAQQTSKRSWNTWTICSMLNSHMTRYLCHQLSGVKSQLQTHFSTFLLCFFLTKLKMNEKRMPMRTDNQVNHQCVEPTYFLQILVITHILIPRLHDEANIKQICSIYTCMMCALSLPHVCFIV